MRAAGTNPRLDNVPHWPPAVKCRGGHQNELDDESAAAADNSAEDIKWEAAISEMVRCNPGDDSNAQCRTYSKQYIDIRFCIQKK